MQLTIKNKREADLLLSLLKNGAEHFGDMAEKAQSRDEYGGWLENIDIIERWEKEIKT